MVYTKKDFKRLWEANEYGSGITHDDIADCAVAWGISEFSRIRPFGDITYRVLKAAEVNDAEEYNPNPTPQCEGPIKKLAFPHSRGNERYVKVLAKLKTWTTVEDIIEYDTYNECFVIPNGYQIDTKVISWEYYKELKSLVEQLKGK